MFRNESLTNIDMFTNRLYKKNNINFADNYGLTDETMNPNSDFIFDIKNLMIFNNKGVLIIHSKFKKNNIEIDVMKIYKLIIRLSKNNKTDDFNFYRFCLDNNKLTLLYKNEYIICGIFSNTKSSIIKMYLLHMFIAFENFCIDFIKNSYKYLNYDSGNKNNNFYETIIFKLFENYFSTPITRHFERIIRCIIRKEDMYMTNIKFKNFYILNLKSNELLFNMQQLRGSQKYKHIYHNEQLWQELLFHSRNLRENYFKTNNYQYDSSDNQYNFVKFECSSTYPRLFFMIKFLPILNGVSIIHVYSQNKLSRSNDDNNIIIHKFYKECDIIYGNDIKNLNNLDFRYTEPKKLKEIDNFFIKFYLSIKPNNNYFYDNNRDLKYVNYEISELIDEVICSNKNYSIDNIVSKINSRLYDIYMNRGHYENIKYEADLESLRQSSQESNTNSYLYDKCLLNDNFLNIRKEFILKEIFKNDNLIKEEVMKIENTLVFSKLSAEDNNYDNFDSIQLSHLSNISKFEDTQNVISHNITGFNNNISASDIMLHEIDKSSNYYGYINSIHSIKKSDLNSNRADNIKKLEKVRSISNNENRKNLDKRTISSIPKSIHRGINSFNLKEDNNTYKFKKVNISSKDDELNDIRNEIFYVPKETFYQNIHTDGQINKNHNIITTNNNNEQSFRVSFKDDSNIKY